MNKWLNQLSYRYLPGICLLCKARSHRNLDLCIACEQDLPIVVDPCWQCGLGLQAGFCPACASNPPVWSHCYAIFSYQPPINILIHRFKDKGNLIVGKVLAAALAVNFLRDHLYLPDLLVPVPLHPSRLRQRGFNQAEETARVIADVCNLSMSSRLCERTRNTLDQKLLDRESRMRNLTSAFKINPRLSEHLRGKRVAIVDDVVTTGATASALALKLTAAGAEDVQVISLARTRAK